MSATTSSPSACYPADERRPLLESRTACVQANVQSDLEAAVPADKVEEIQAVVKTASFWTILWYLVITILGGTLFSGVIKAFVEKCGIQVGIVVHPTSTASGRSRLACNTTARPQTGIIMCAR